MMTIKLRRSSKYPLLNFGSGQSIIELVVVISIATFLILALVSLASRSNRSGDTSRNSAQASKLAAEGIEVLHTIRKLNEPGVIIPSNGSANPSCLGEVSWTEFYACPVNSVLLCPGGSACNDNPPLSNFSVPADIGSPKYGHRYVFHPHDVHPLRGSTYSLDGNGDSQTDFTIEIDRVLFSRALFVADEPPISQCNNGGDSDKVKQYTVLVTWEDTAGAHETVNTTCLGRL